MPAMVSVNSGVRWISPSCSTAGPPMWYALIPRVYPSPWTSRRATSTYSTISGLNWTTRAADGRQSPQASSPISTGSRIGARAVFTGDTILPQNALGLSPVPMPNGSLTRNDLHEPCAA